MFTKINKAVLCLSCHYFIELRAVKGVICASHNKTFSVFLPRRKFTTSDNNCREILLVLPVTPSKIIVGSISYEVRVALRWSSSVLKLIQLQEERESKPEQN